MHVGMYVLTFMYVYISVCRTRHGALGRQSLAVYSRSQKLLNMPVLSSKHERSKEHQHKSPYAHVAIQLNMALL